MPDKNPGVGAATVMAALYTDAEAAGLPLPYNGAVTDYAPAGHPLGEAPHYGRVGGICLLIDEGDLAEWSVFLDAVPYSGVTSGHRVHAHLDATVNGVAVRVTALVPIEAEVSA